MGKPENFHKRHPRRNAVILIKEKRTSRFFQGVIVGALIGVVLKIKKDLLTETKREELKSHVRDIAKKVEAKAS